MIKENKRKLLISSVVTLLPILFGVIFWNELPEQMTTHWGANGEADGWSGRGFAVFVLPLILLAAHWLCIFGTMLDSRNKNQNRKVFGIVIWIIPVLSLLVNGMTYSVALGKEFNPLVLANVLLGTTFILIGNYLPKCKQNYTIGIKIKWTLENEENWNATHRFGGKVWVAGGVLFLACSFLPETVWVWVMLLSVLVLVGVPVAYSYGYHRKQVREGTAVITPIPKTKLGKFHWIIPVAILVFVAVLMFTGEIAVNYGEDSFTIEASYWQDLTVEYDVIDSIEYRDTDNAGTRVGGFASARLLAGNFRNGEFGNYTRYSYTRPDACVVLDVEGKTLVIGGPDAESTKAIYEEIKANIE